MKNNDAINVGARENQNIGDVVHLSAHKADATINIDDLYAKAKVNEKDPQQGGWIVVTAESNKLQGNEYASWLDQNTNINVTNSNWDNFETGIHAETWNGNMYINADNVKFRGRNWETLSNVNGEAEFLTKNSTINLQDKGRWELLHGVYIGQSFINPRYKLAMYNSTVNRADDLSKRKPVTGTHGNGIKAEFHGTTFNDVADMLGANSTISLINSAVNTSSDNHRTTKEALLDGATYGTTTGTVFKFNPTTKAVAPKVTAPTKFYNDDNYNAPDVTKPMNPGM